MAQPDVGRDRRRRRAEQRPKIQRLGHWALTHWGKIRTEFRRIGTAPGELTATEFWEHVQELLIEDTLADPALAGMSREEQRRRILFELEAPILPSGPSGSSTQPAEPKPRKTVAQARYEQLQAQIRAEKDLAKRLELTQQLRALADMMRDEPDRSAS